MHVFICVSTLWDICLGWSSSRTAAQAVLGFHQVLGEVTLHATDRCQLLSSVWKAFAHLWEEALQVLSIDLGIHRCLASANVKGTSCLMFIRVGTFPHVHAVHHALAMCEPCIGLAA